MENALAANRSREGVIARSDASGRCYPRSPAPTPVTGTGTAEPKLGTVRSRRVMMSGREIFTRAPMLRSERMLAGGLFPVKPMKDRG